MAVRDVVTTSVMEVITRQYNETNYYPDYCKNTRHESKRGTITVAVRGKEIDELLSIFSKIQVVVYLSMLRSDW